MLRRLSPGAAFLILVLSIVSCASKGASQYLPERLVGTVEVTSKALLPDRVKLAQMGLTMADVEPPILTKKVTPEYPDGARQARVQGPTELKCVIGVRGEVSTCVVIRRLSPDCDNEAIHAVSQWMFTPAKLKGRVTAVYVNITVRYRLQAP